MRLTSLSLTSFRNHAETRHAFEGDLTVFVGKNAAGKTSLLEAVRCLSLAKSFRAVSDQDLISHGAAYCRAEALFLREGAERRIAYFQELAPPEGGAARKRILIDGVRRPVRQLLGTLPTVLFTPEDLALITDAPRVRRSYLDALLCQASPEYYASLVSLRRILAQRNRLLSQIRETGQGEDQLDAWDAPFILHARTILIARQELLIRFNERLPDAYGRIAGHPSVLRLSASISLPEDTLDERLAAGRSADIRAARTLRGPHRDDIAFLLSDLPLASFASRGEQRSAILALKDAELSILEEIFGERPILLLDDIFSELDADRQNALLELVRKQQTLITTTDLTHIHPSTQEGAAIVEIQRGAVAETPAEPTTEPTVPVSV